MNVEKLKQAQARFLLQYPGGFAHPEMIAIAKKHKVEKMNRLAQESFALPQFADTDGIVVAIGKVVSQSLLVSVFEKPKFRELTGVLNGQERQQLATGLREWLHADQEHGFSLMASVLAQHKLAKWPLLTVCPTYYRPEFEAFIKPTTAKRVIEYFELDGLRYSPTPTFAFYQAYRERINQMKQMLRGEGLPADNAAFCGFLMMAIDSDEAAPDSSADPGR